MVKVRQDALGTDTQVEESSRSVKRAVALILKDPAIMPECLANFLIAPGLAALPTELYWGGDAAPTMGPGGSIDLGAMPEELHLTPPEEAYTFPLARQVVDYLRGPTPRTVVEPGEAVQEGFPTRPTSFPDGSVSNPDMPWAASAGAGVWEPGRLVQDRPITEQEDIYSHTEHAPDGVRKWVAL